MLKENNDSWDMVTVNGFALRKIFKQYSTFLKFLTVLELKSTCRFAIKKTFFYFFIIIGIVKLFVTVFVSIFA